MNDPLTLHIHNDIKDAVSWFKIPSSHYKDDDFYIMQEDRCVFVGSVQLAKSWLTQNTDKYCKSIYPLTF